MAVKFIYLNYLECLVNVLLNGYVIAIVGRTILWILILLLFLDCFFLLFAQELLPVCPLVHFQFLAGAEGGQTRVKSERRPF